MNLRLIISAVAVAACAVTADACTSMIVSASRSATGRPLLWKHRDTSQESNFVERREAVNGRHAYTALYNAGDSTLSEAWMGVNDADFAIMNTASYNLAPDTARYKDREGAVMAEALAVCETVDDFERLLERLPKPMGVQANFGVIDANGDGAYFEADDYTFKRYDLKDAENGVLIRTNYSMSGNDTDGYGYIRYENARRQIAPAIANHSVSPELLTEGISRSFYHSLLDRDMAADDAGRWIIDQDYIPRRSSTASVVIEGVTPGSSGEKSVMWTALGYPPCAAVEAATVDFVPETMRPTRPGWKSVSAERTIEMKHRAFPITRGSGPHYIDMDYLRPVIAARRAESMAAYKAFREKQQK